MTLWCLANSVTSLNQIENVLYEGFNEFIQNKNQKCISTGQEGSAAKKQQRNVCSISEVLQQRPMGKQRQMIESSEAMS